MKKIVVLGAGTVGVMSVLHFLKYTKHEITCIHSSQKNILGIGESSNIQLPQLLWNSIKLNPYEDQDLEMTIKYGVKYSNWRDKHFFNPILPNQYAIHFNNFKLAEVSFKKCKQIYKDRFKEIDSIIEDVDQIKNEYDYVIDCRGYPEDYSDYHMSNLPLNHCLVRAVPEPGNWQYTHHYAHRNGWMFGIPLKTRQGWGYLFNDRITSIDEAVYDINNIFQDNLDYSDLRKFKFKPYRSNVFLKDNIIRNGNRAIFYEPLEALSGGFYDLINRSFYDYLIGDKTEAEVNYFLYQKAIEYERFIAFVYQGGSTYNTPFWKDAVNRSKDIIQEYDFEKAMKDNTWPFSYDSWKLLNDGLEYRYI